MENDNQNIHKVIIIGGGPAGLTAAIYASRAELKPLVIEGYQAGGQLMGTTDIENFPGVGEKVTGPQLIVNMKQQAQRFGTEFLTTNVDSVNLAQQPFEVKAGDKTLLTQTLIIATGADARWLGLESEEKMKGRGVSACATCDGPFFKDKEIAVIGGGDSAMEEANFLTRFTSKVTIVHRREELRASKIMQEKAKNNPKIEFRFNATVEEVLGDTSVTGLKLKDIQTGETSTLECQGVFISIGHKPNTNLFKDQLELDQKAYIVTKANSTVTSKEGVFACGDVQDHVFRQAITAAGSGCMAAIEVERYLAEKE
ncbi:MAG: thioredoxin-disulfide reductase [archaeon]|nr:thioredoxin-disulfide reductase [Nanoarchaeota archaeon]